MRMRPVVLGCGWGAFLAFASWGTAQEVEPPCAGKGASAPGWYAEPPEPPPSVHQAEARSGGCPDAETAQTVAARLAARLLLQARSSSSVLTEVRMSRRQQGSGGAGEIEHDVEVLERAFTQKVMDRSWVYRQETRWTAEGRTEHFLILRAETAAVREVAAEELAGAFPGGGVSGSVRDDFEWVSLDGTEEGPQPTERRAAPLVSSSRATGNPFADLKPPEFRRLVMDWQTAPNARDPSAWPGEGRVGLALGTDGTGFHGALGARVAFGGRQTLQGMAGGSALQITDDRRLDALLLAGLPRQLVPVYGGYRYHWMRLGSGTVHQELDGEALVVGLGYPFFTELAGAWLKNAYLEAAVLPDLQAIGAGGRIGLAQGSRIGVNAVFRGTVDLTEMGGGIGFAGPEGGTASDGRVLDRFGLEAGLEVRLANRVGVFALGRFERMKVGQVEDPGGDRYGLLFRPMRTLGDPETEVGVRVGVRVAF